MPRLTPKRSILVLLTLLAIKHYQNIIHQEYEKSLHEMDKLEDLYSHDYYFKIKTQNQSGAKSQSKLKITHKTHHRASKLPVEYYHYTSLDYPENSETRKLSPADAQESMKSKVTKALIDSIFIHTAPKQSTRNKISEMMIKKANHRLKQHLENDQSKLDQLSNKISQVQQNSRANIPKIHPFNQPDKKLCLHLPDNLDSFPNCIKRMMELEQVYTGNVCLAYLKDIDHSKSDKRMHCEFQEYLATFEHSCPSILKSKAGKFSSKRVLRHEVASLVESLEKTWFLRDTDQNLHPNKVMQFTRDRIQQFSFSWGVGSFRIYQLHNEMNENFSKRSRTGQNSPNLGEGKKMTTGLEKHKPWLVETLNILIFTTSITDIIESNFLPETEKIMWSDLITGLYILGHNLTIAQTQNQALELSGINFLRHDFKRSCPEVDAKFNSWDLILTDIHAARILKNHALESMDQNHLKDNLHLKIENWHFIKCRLKVVLGFPIDAEFNHPTGVSFGE